MMLPGIVRGNSRPNCVQKVHKNCTRLVQNLHKNCTRLIQNLCKNCNFDGSVDIPKYKQYQYLEDGTDFALNTDQSRAELFKYIPPKKAKKQSLVTIHQMPRRPVSLSLNRKS